MIFFALFYSLLSHVNRFKDDIFFSIIDHYPRYRTIIFVSIKSSYSVALALIIEASLESNFQFWIQINLKLPDVFSDIDEIGELVTWRILSIMEKRFQYGEAFSTMEKSFYYGEAFSIIEKPFRNGEAIPLW